MTYGYSRFSSARSFVQRPRLSFRVDDERGTPVMRIGGEALECLLFGSQGLDILGGDGSRVLSMSGEAHVVLIGGVGTLATVVVDPASLPPSAALRASLARRLSGLGVELIGRTDDRLKPLNPWRSRFPCAEPEADSVPSMASGSAADQVGPRMASYALAERGEAVGRSRAALSAAALGAPHVADYADEHICSAVSRRPMLRAMLAAAAERRFTHVVVADLAQFARDIDIRRAILRELALNGVVVLPLSGRRG